MPQTKRARSISRSRSRSAKRLRVRSNNSIENIAEFMTKNLPNVYMQKTFRKYRFSKPPRGKYGFAHSAPFTRSHSDYEEYMNDALKNIGKGKKKRKSRRKHRKH
tara:strand:+ start:13 stop:327 length:315 start_codon:yes stop_codon:yes gene_type:complete